MKKINIIYSIAFIVLSLTAIGCISRNDSKTDPLETSVGDNVAINTQAVEKINKRTYTDFIYDVGPRFSPIKKGDLDKARSIIDFLPKELTQRVVSYKSVEIIVIIDDKQSDIRETGNSGVLTDAQIKLLRSFNYSTNIKIRADYLEKNQETGELGYSYSSPHLTIVPEKQAKYVFGKDALIYYLKENTKEETAGIPADKLKPAKLFFTVTKKGAISNVKLDRTSGFPSIDNMMIDLIKKAPGKWEAAENLKGKKVDQELVISFGLMGC